MSKGLFIDIDRASMRGVTKALDDLPKNLQKSAAKAVLRAGAAPVLKAMKSRVPVDTGLLKKSLGLSARTQQFGSGKVWGWGKIGPRKGYLSKKKLTGRKRQRATKGKRSTWIENKKIDMQELAFYIETGTPTLPANPFIRDAIDAAQGQVLDAMAAGLEKHLTRVAARLAKGK